MKCRLSARRLLISVAFLAAPLWMLSPTISSQETPSNRADSQRLPNPIVGTHEFMELFNEPLYKSLRSSLDDEPSGNEWKKIEGDAYRTAEVANLIALRDMAKEFPEWSQHAQGVQRAALQLVEAAKQNEYSASRKAFASLVESCNSCHRATKPGHAPQLDKPKSER